MIIIAYWILKSKTSEKGFVCFLILYCIYCSINITVFFSNILLSLHIMTWFLALKTSISLLIWSKFIEKFFILVLLKKANCSMLSPTDTHTFAYSRIHYSSLRDKMIGCHFWKFISNICILLYEIRHDLLETKKKYILKSRTLPSNHLLLYVDNFQCFYCFITRQCITLPICFKAKQLWFQIKFLTKE